MMQGPLAGSGTVAGENPAAKQNELTADVLAGNLRKIVQSVIDPKYQSDWIKFAQDDFTRGDKFTQILNVIEDQLKQVSDDIIQAAVSQFTGSLAKEPLTQMGSKDAAALVISAIMHTKKMASLEVNADFFLPKREYYEQGYKGAQFLGYNLPEEATLYLTTGGDPLKQYSDEEVGKCLGFAGQAKIFINGTSLEEFQANEGSQKLAKPTDTSAFHSSGKRAFYLEYPSSAVEHTEDFERRVISLHDGLCRASSDLHKEILEAIRGVDSESALIAAREYIAEKMHGSINHTPGGEVSDLNKGAIDQFAKETILSSEILDSFKRLRDEGGFADPENVWARAVESAREILAEVEPSLVERGVRCFLEVHSEDILASRAHSTEESAGKKWFSHFISPFMIEVFCANPELNSFVVDFARYHSKPQVSMGEFGFGMESTLEPDNRDGKHILVKGVGSTSISAMRGLVKGVRYG